MSRMNGKKTHTQYLFGVITKKGVNVCVMAGLESFPIGSHLEKPHTLVSETVHATTITRNNSYSRPRIDKGCSRPTDCTFPTQAPSFIHGIHHGWRSDDEFKEDKLKKM